MKIDVDHNGGVLIAGTWNEIDDLVDSLREALFEREPGEWSAGQILADEGVVTMTVRIDEVDDD